MSSADNSFASSADDSLHQMSSNDLTLDTSAMAPDRTLLCTPMSSKSNASRSGTADSMSLSDGKKYHRARVRRENSVTDNSAVLPSSFLHKRRRLKFPPSVDDDIVECGRSPTRQGRSPARQQLKRNLSQRLPSDDNSHIELGEIHRKRRRRLKCTLTQLLPSDIDGGVETVALKRRRLSASKKSSPKARNKVAEDAATTVTSSRAQFEKVVRDAVVANDVPLACSSTGKAWSTNSAVITNSASRQAPLQLQNVLTGRRYVLQPVKVMLSILYM